ncbi:MAG: bifunctional UDP-N-acetylglucosamine diphosphorylase/glucosamine-1-phosphate N-acetyltransferase GlmU [Bdellovibrionota bacterium]
MPRSLDRSLGVIILAAGLGTRMRSQTPKVLHKVCREPMLALLLDALDQALRPYQGSRFNIVIGHGRDQVKQMVEGLRGSSKVQTPVIYTTQEQQLGTGHAVKLALESFQKTKLPFRTIAVFNGDLPIFSASDFEAFLEAHQQNKSVASLASATLDDAGQYGRILRASRKFVGVVEYKDATVSQRKIREYNGGVYLFDRETLEGALGQMKNKNKAQEFYLPDVFSYAYKKKKRILAYQFDDPNTLAGVNNMEELAAAQQTLYYKTAKKLMQAGVFLAEPRHTYIGPQVEFGSDCAIAPFTSIHGRSKIADRVQIGSHCDLTEVAIGESSVIRNSTVAEKSIIGKECIVGPMVQLRPGSQLKDHVRVGNFVEVKESIIGSHTNAAHLSYIGDAEIGSNVNLGCGFVTCNYDGTVREGRRKHQTIIGDDVFVGSDSQVVAPIQIADGTYIASGSTVTESVSEPDSLVIARTRQVVKPGYAKKYKRRK